MRVINEFHNILLPVSVPSVRQVRKQVCLIVKVFVVAFLCL